MDDAAAAVGFEAGLFDDVVECAGIAHLLEGKGRVGLVGGNQLDGADAQCAVEQAPSQFQVNDAEHIEIVNLPVEHAPAPFDAVGGDFVARHLELEQLDQKQQHRNKNKPDAEEDSVLAECQQLLLGKLKFEQLVGHSFDGPLRYENPQSDKEGGLYGGTDHAEQRGTTCKKYVVLRWQGLARQLGFEGFGFVGVEELGAESALYRLDANHLATERALFHSRLFECYGRHIFKYRQTAQDYSNHQITDSIDPGSLLDASRMTNRYRIS